MVLIGDSGPIQRDKELPVLEADSCPGRKGRRLREVQADGRCSHLPGGGNHRAGAAGNGASRDGLDLACNEAQEGADGQEAQAGGRGRLRTGVSSFLRSGLGMKKLLTVTLLASSGE